MGRYLEDFRVGELIKHWPGRTIRDFDDTWFTLLTMNTNPLHFDEHFASQSQHGRCLVNGTLVFALTVGMSVRDISENALANLEYEKIVHLAPTFHGDTIYAESDGLATALVGIGPLGGTARADEAPSDPTRGQWDSFLDPLRDFEDNSVTATQKSVEDATKIHLGLGFTEAYTWDFNKPRSGSLIALHSLEHHNDGVPALGQLAASRPSEGWFIPGFGMKLDAGKGARDVKADWNGKGAGKHS